MNPSQPDIQQKFVSEGRFFTSPLSVVDECLPILPEDCPITAFCEDKKHLNFSGATSGQQCHIFSGSYKGASGGIIDLGIVEGAIEIPYVSYVGAPNWNKNKKRTYLTAANTEEGHEWHVHRSASPEDTIQEPNFQMVKPKCLHRIKGYSVLSAHLIEAGEKVLILCDRALLKLDLASGQHQEILSFEAAPLTSLEACGPEVLCFLDHQSQVIKLETLNLKTSATKLVVPDVHCQAIGMHPKGMQLSASCSHAHEQAIFSSQDGRLWAYASGDTELKALGKAPLGPIQCMASSPNQHLYTIGGQDIGFFSKTRLQDGVTESLGAIATTMGAKRYGFEFSNMITGGDGEIYLLEKDRGAHLWMYFPKIESPS